MTDRRRTARTAADLVAAGLAAEQDMSWIEPLSREFSIAVTPAVMDMIESPDDPIARQFLPDRAEMVSDPAELADPIGDHVYSPVKGVVHRYPDRVLLKPIHSCPVYCRFCFRREQVGHDGESLSVAEMSAALDYIRAHDGIWEVILSGGDPMMLPPARMAAIVAALDAIPHVEVIRIHSRVPVTDPSRISPAMIAALKAETPVYVVVHCNHARELTETARGACRALADAGLPLLAQTVLLKNINDDPETMAQLMRALVRNRIKPYYLHHGDLARGTGHFRTNVAEGQSLMRHLRGKLSGICQPTYVLDIPGGHGKAPIGPVFWHGSAPGGAAEGEVEDWRGNRHDYPPR